MMTVRLHELRSKLKTTGSLYLHCDPSASHYLKILLDAIFGAQKEVAGQAYHFVLVVPHALVRGI
jgi:adenine specific DNA methylase Mod